MEVELFPRPPKLFWLRANIADLYTICMDLPPVSKKVFESART